jgi:allophanate hydrolase
MVSWQDAGRPGMMRFGVPASGPMDRLAHAAAQAALRQPLQATALEVSVAGIELACEWGEVSCSITGGDFQVRHAGVTARAWCVRTLRAGEVLSIRPGRWGSWAYLAFAGDPPCSPWAGSTATHMASGIGGGVVGTGTGITVRNARVKEDSEGELQVPDASRPTGWARVVLGPQLEHFHPDAVATLLEQPFTVTPAFDRMGMRLAGPALRLGNALSIPSEPLVRGSIQVSGDGVSSILLADHQTTGGYPKIATIVSCDLDSVSQLRAGDTLRFEAVKAHDAVALARCAAGAQSAYLNGLKTARSTLSERLMRLNLVDGMVRAEEGARLSASQD